MNTHHLKYDQAHNLYFQTELTQAEIARLINVSDKTIYRWINEGQWKNIKTSARQTPVIIVEQFYTQLSALNLAISKREERPYPTKEEADLIRKLTLSIKTTKQGQTRGDNIQMMMHFIDQFKIDDPDLAEKIIYHADKFITGKPQKGFNPWQIEYQSLQEQHQQRFEENLAAELKETIHTQSLTGHQPDIDIHHLQSQKSPQTTDNQKAKKIMPTTQNVNNKKTPPPDIPPQQIGNIPTMEETKIIFQRWEEEAHKLWKRKHR